MEHYKPTVYQLRAGAPDKFALESKCNLVKLDNTNLVDLTINEINEMTSKGYILPADEGDIQYANKIASKLSNPNRILLPKFGGKEIISYKDIVSKAGPVYNESGVYIRFPKFDTYTKYTIASKAGESGFAIKPEYGSGSRGVHIITASKDYVNMKNVSKRLTKGLINSMSEGKYVVQDLIPITEKINVDFVIRNGRLLGYKWTKMNQSQLNTNWDNGDIIRNEFTDKVANEFLEILHRHSITDGLLNFEAFYSAEQRTVTIIEVNWRYSNSMFEWSAFGLDPIYAYITNTKIEIPMGIHHFTRYWQCALYTDFIDPDRDSPNKDELNSWVKFNFNINGTDAVGTSELATSLGSFVSKVRTGVYKYSNGYLVDPAFPMNELMKLVSPSELIQLEEVVNNLVSQCESLCQVIKLGESTWVVPINKTKYIYAPNTDKSKLVARESYSDDVDLLVIISTADNPVLDMNINLDSIAMLPIQMV